MLCHPRRDVRKSVTLQVLKCIIRDFFSNINRTAHNYDDDDVPTISAGFELVVTTHKVLCVCVVAGGEFLCRGGGGAGWLRFDSKRRTREERELVTEKGGGAGSRQ